MDGPERSAGPRSHDVLRHKQGGEAEEPDQEISFEGSIEDGAIASKTLLAQDLLSGALRERLMNRP